jgi:hypothetical protein
MNDTLVKVLLEGLKTIQANPQMGPQGLSLVAGFTVQLVMSLNTQDQAAQQVTRKAIGFTAK